MNQQTQTTIKTDHTNGEIKRLSESLSVLFKDSRLLRMALTHESFLKVTFEKDMLSNERLEFLGDKVLGLLTAEYLFRTFPASDEGHMTKILSYIVSDVFIARLGEELRLHEHLLLGYTESRLIKEQKKFKDTVNACAFEAILGAIYLDSGIKAVERVLQQRLFPKVRIIVKNEEYVHAKAKFIEMCQKRHKKPPRFVVLEIDDPHSDHRYEVGIFINKKRLMTGFGDSEREAQMDAVQKILAQGIMC